MSDYDRDLPEDDVSTYSRTAIVVSAVLSLIVTALLAWAAAGFDVFHEDLFRVAPTVEGGGIGADWVTGNTMPALDFLIALTHAADAIMGVFILFMVFLHWAAFRRLAARMRKPGETRSASGVAADGGVHHPEDRVEQPNEGVHQTDDHIEQPEGGTERSDSDAVESNGGDAE